MVRAITNRLLPALMAVGLAATGASLNAQDAEAPKREPHPTMVLFLEEIEAGELEKAAARIISVNDSFGRQELYQYFTQAELTALLATCDLAVHTSLKLTLAIEKTEWDCPDGERYLMIFNSAGEAPNPYLYVGRIETNRAKEAREALFRELYASGPPPPLALNMVTPEERAARAEQRRLQEADNPRKRDLVGQAILTGNLEPLAEFVTEKSNSAYITHDPYFDVKIKHINGVGWDDLAEVVRRARVELGEPVSVECKTGEGRWAPEICEWQLPNPENTLRAEMNFAGEGGSMNSIRVFRRTPEEDAAMREQAESLGITIN